MKIFNFQKAADRFINTSPYFDILKKHGSLFFTGSYFFNTMTWLDIDMQLLIPEGKSQSKTIARIINQLISNDSVKHIEYTNFIRYPKNYMPEGLYIGCHHYDKDINEFWKLDLWILSQNAFSQNRAFLEEINNKMSQVDYEKIMTIKRKWTRTYGRPPKLASYYLYQAVVLYGIKEYEKIKFFLSEKGVKF